jgi:Flp pilus assembly protein TadB
MDATQGEAVKPGRRVPSTTLTFYRYHGIVITGRALLVDDREYRLADLSDLRMERGPRDRLTALLGAGLAAAAVAVVLAAWYLDLAGWVGAFAVLLALGCALGYRMATRPRLHELHAEYGGHLVVLLSERNGLRFGQICRALARALEHGQPRR